MDIKVYENNKEDFIKEFYKNVEKTSTCWIWKGSKTSTGYGDFRYKNQRMKAHRFSFLISNGHMAKNYVCHKCNNPLCVNPSHLYDGTPKDNVRDMLLAKHQNNQSKMYCKRGHRLTEDNVYIHKTGSRRCKECHKLYYKNKK